jgi:hypothetical protein
MENIRIPIDLTQDRNITFKLEQDFDQLEVLSLKMSAYDVYAQMTSDFGVVVGRINVNGGFGVQNAKISVFVPITTADEQRNEITQLYPFKSPVDKLPNGVRYNLLPRVKQSNFSHQPIGCFPDVTDLTYYPTYLEIYEKYYKYTTTTNDSGDYMIFGVPLGAQYVHMDFDLFDTKSFYITADDLVTEIKTSTTVSAQLSAELTQAINPDFELTTGGTYNVKVKSDLNTMPNVFSDDKILNVVPFWGDATLHEIGITRCDFEINYQYVPTAILFGSLVNMSYWASIGQAYMEPTLKFNYVVSVGDGGKGLSISQHNAAIDLKVIAYKVLGAYTVERYGIYSAIPSADSSANGVFVISLPMYEDYYVTNEFGQLVPSTSKRGVPTKGHYAFEFFDDYEGMYGNGRRSPDGWEGQNYWGNLTAGVRVPADRSGHQYLSGWRTSAYDDSTLFEYDVLKGSPRFYTVQTEFRKHRGSPTGNGGFDNVDVRQPAGSNGGVIAYLPKIDSAQSYNIPIDNSNPPDKAILRGTLFSPRFLVQDYPEQTTLLFANELLWIPWYPKSDTANYQTKVWDWIYGVGVRHLQGVNRGEVYSQLYSKTTADGKEIGEYDETLTWFFGDNPWDGENVPIANYYAQLLAQKPDATGRNISSIHNRFNLAISPNYTAGLFVSSVNFGTSKILFETSIADITDELPNLIRDSVYSSYGKDGNQYNGSYYLFGPYQRWQNALHIIKGRYFNE